MRLKAIALGAVLLGAAATLFAPNVIQLFPSTHCVSKIERDFRDIDGALGDYSIANGGRFPSSMSELVTPDEHGRAYLDCTHVPLDPWGREYIYGAPGPGQTWPLVSSFGKDGRRGGDGDDEDVDNLSIRRLSQR